MHVKYIIHTVYFLHVSATHVTIFREVYYKGQIHRDITEAFETDRYKILSFKDNVIIYNKITVIYIIYRPR